MSDENTLSRKSPRVIGALVAVLALVLLGVAYGVSRAALSFDAQIIVVGLLVIAFAVFAYLGVRAGHIAPFVVTALLLPYALVGVMAYGSAQRLTSELDGIFGSDSSSSNYDEDYEADEDEEEPAEEVVPAGNPVDIAKKIDGCELEPNAVSGSGDDNMRSTFCTIQGTDVDGEPVEGQVYVETFSGTKEDYEAENGLAPSDDDSWHVVGDGFLVTFQRSENDNGPTEDEALKMLGGELVPRADGTK